MVFTAEPAGPTFDLSGQSEQIIAAAKGDFSDSVAARERALGVPGARLAP
jgi:hypothetical protein